MKNPKTFQYTFLLAVDAVSRLAFDSPGTTLNLVKMSRYARLAVHAWCNNDRDGYLEASQRFNHYWSSPYRSADIDNSLLSALARGVHDPGSQAGYLRTHYQKHFCGYAVHSKASPRLCVLDVKGIPLHESLCVAGPIKKRYHTPLYLG